MTHCQITCIGSSLAYHIHWWIRQLGNMDFCLAAVFCLNGKLIFAPLSVWFADLIDGSGVLNCFRHLDRMGSGRSSTGGGSGRGSITSSVIGGAGGGVGSGIVIGGGVAEDMSSSSFSSTDAPSSPTASYSGENLLHFHGDSSGSLWRWFHSTL